MSAKDKNDNEMTQGAVQRYPGIHLAAEDNPGNPYLGYCLMEAVLLIASNGVANLQMMSVVAQFVEEGRRKERKRLIC